MYEHISVFIRDHLLHGDDYAANIHKNYRQVYRDPLHTPHLKHLSTYNSFAKRIARLMRAGLIERSGIVEPSSNPHLEDRVYLRLTTLGRSSSTLEWVRADHGEE